MSVPRSVIGLFPKIVQETDQDDGGTKLDKKQRDKKNWENAPTFHLTSVPTDVQIRQACISLISWANSDIKWYCLRKQNILKKIWSNKR